MVCQKNLEKMLDLLEQQQIPAYTAEYFVLGWFEIRIQRKFTEG